MVSGLNKKQRETFVSETAGMIFKEGQTEHAWEYNQYNAGVLDVIFDRVTKIQLLIVI